ACHADLHQHEKRARAADERREQRVELVSTAADQNVRQYGIARTESEDESRDRKPPRVEPVDGGERVLPGPPWPEPPRIEAAIHQRARHARAPVRSAAPLGLALGGGNSIAAIEQNGHGCVLFDDDAATRDFSCRAAGMPGSQA